MASSRRSGWHLVGLVFMVLTFLAGIAVVGFAIVFVIGMNQWASNK